MNDPKPVSEQQPSPLTKADPGWWAIGLIVLFAGGILVAIGMDAQALNKLADPAYARGLITWLVILTTIGIAFILIYQAFNGSAQSDDGFRRGREIFAGLLGMAGTIIGFYFGSADKTDALLKVSTPDQEGLVLRAYVSGGTPPYRYSIDPPDGTLFKSPDKPATTDSGWIKVDLAASPSGHTAVTLTVTDAKNMKGSSKGEIKPIPKGEEKEKTTKVDGAIEQQKSSTTTQTTQSNAAAGSASDVKK